MKTPEREALLQALKTRFEKHMHRHAGAQSYYAARGFLGWLSV